MPSSGSLAEPNCTAPFIAVGSQCLFFANDLTVDKIEAQIICEALTGNLVIIDAPQKLDDVVAYIKTNYNNLQRSYWIDGERSTSNRWQFTTGGISIPLGTPFWGTSKAHNGIFEQRPLNNSGDCLSLPYDKSYFFTETSCDLDIHSPLCEPGPVTPCGGNFTEPQGWFTSPNFPNNYPSDSDCRWTVITEDDTTLTVTFEEFDTDSSGDYLEIRDGSDSDAELLVRLSSYHSSDDIGEIKSTNNSLYFYFHSDYYYERSGFQLYWTTESAFPCPPLYTKFGLGCYAFVFNPETFNEAKITCASINGQLGKITNVQQLRQLYTYIHDSGIADDSFWVGGEDQDVEGNFVFEDGTTVPLGTPFWGTSGENSEVQEPDGNRAENCVALLAEGYHFFRDTVCTNQLKFICSPI
ncbi:unnamed protein product [Meganyctiphanes norvegica]|uniref:Uncharacterized protein n=1 Tax=Meganyctiphanes norvegica TaxID=48144 RepID=A0AAV2QAK2_MEGNR